MSKKLFTKDEIDLKICTTFYELESTINNYMDYYNNYRYQSGLKKLNIGTSF